MRRRERESEAERERERERERDTERERERERERGWNDVAATFAATWTLRIVHVSETFLL